MAAAGLAILVLLAGLGPLLKQGSPKSPPAVPLEDLDPAVRTLVETSLAEVMKSSKSSAAWGRLGSVLMHYDLPEQAETALAQAEQLAPNDPRWPYLQALLLWSRHPDRASAKLQQAVHLAGDDPDMPRLQWARALAERGDEKEAAAEFGRLLDARPDHAAARLGLARLALASGRLSPDYLGPCLTNPHTAKAAHALLAQLEQVRDNPDAARQAADQIRFLPDDEPWPDPYWEEALAYRVGRRAMLQDASDWMDQGRWEEAIAVLEQATREYADDPEGWYLLGWALNRQGRPPEAEAALREHLRRTPRSAKGLSQLAVALLSQQRAEEAVQILQSALRLKPTWRELHFNLGYASAQLERETEAIAHLRRALALDPGHALTYVALAQLLARRGERDEARRLLQQALQISPDVPGADVLLQDL